MKLLKNSQFGEAVSYYYTFGEFINPDQVSQRLEIVDYLIKEDNNLTDVFEQKLPSSDPQNRNCYQNYFKADPAR